MNFQQLSYFITLSETGSFSGAARKLMISQQGLSASMSKLESEFSRKFFKRVPNGVILTEDGEQFLLHAKVIHARLDECKSHLRKAR